MKHLISFLSIFLFLASANAQLTENHLQKEINKIIYYDAGINYDEVPGFIIGIVIEDSTYVFDFGSMDKKGTENINRDHIFELGGISKVFMASLVHLLAEEGVLSLDDDLNKYLNEDQKNPNVNVKISDILYHTTGFPRLPHGIGRKEKEANNPYAFYTNSDLFNFYTKYRAIEDDPKYQYSHVTFALLEIAIENIFQKSFGEVMKEKLFDPIDLENTGFDLSAAQKKQFAKGYNIIGNPSKAWRYGSFKGSVGLKSNLSDLLKFVKTNLGVENEELHRVLKAAHLCSEYTALDKNTYIASAWHVLKKKHCDVVVHSGSTAGHRSFVGFVEKTKTGVVVLSNSENGMNSLGFHILRMLNNNWKKIKKKSS